MKTWNQRLASVLAESGMKKSALAAELNVSAPTVQAWVGAPGVAPAVNITGENLLKICRLFHVNAEWLIFGRGAKRDAGSTSDATHFEDGQQPQMSRTPADRRASAERLLAGSSGIEKSAKSPDTATAEELKEEIARAVADQQLSDKLLKAIVWMIRAGMRPAEYDQRKIEPPKRSRSPTRRRTGGG